jgi:hypothetical protein
MILLGSFVNISHLTQILRYTKLLFLFLHRSWRQKPCKTADTVAHMYLIPADASTWEVKAGITRNSWASLFTWQRTGETLSQTGWKARSETQGGPLIRHVHGSSTITHRNTHTHIPFPCFKSCIGFIFQRIVIIKISTQPKAIYRANPIFIKILLVFSTEIKKKKKKKKNATICISAHISTSQFSFPLEINLEAQLLSYRMLLFSYLRN